MTIKSERYDDTEAAIQLEALAIAHDRLAERQRAEVQRLLNSAASHDRISARLRKCLDSDANTRLFAPSAEEIQKSELYISRFLSALSPAQDGDDEIPFDLT
jgi:hypothetical protein